MAEWAKMWVRAFMSTTFSSVSFYTCPCKSTITKTTEKNIMWYFIFIYIVSHHFKKMYKFGTFFFIYFLDCLRFRFIVVIRVWTYVFSWYKCKTFIKDKLQCRDLRPCSGQNPWLFQLPVAISHKRSNKVGRMNYWLGTSVSDK